MRAFQLVLLKSDPKNGALTSKKSQKVTGQQTKLQVSPSTVSFKTSDEAGFIQPRYRGYKSLNPMAAGRLVLASIRHVPDPGDALHG